MPSRVRLVALRILRLCGAFWLAKRLTRNRLRVLCYHGFSYGDEHDASPFTFMRPETFRRRMAILKKHKIPVIPLDAAVGRLKAGSIRSAETVLTFDDGWASNLSVAAPILEQYGYPACVYLTTEHLASGNYYVFNVALAYILHRSRGKRLMLTRVHPQLDGTYEVPSEPKTLLLQLIAASEAAIPDPAKRIRLLEPIAAALDIDLSQVLVSDRFRLMGPNEIEAIAKKGFDVQLHSHRHFLPVSSFESMSEDVACNRSILEKLVGYVPDHFCYPSGKYQPQHANWLASIGIKSATTCDPGMNLPNTPPLLMRRYLDSETSSDIEFEAAICGVREVARSIRGALRGRQ